MSASVPSPAPPLVPLLPESAPFTPAQRAWLNGFFAGLLSRGPLAGPERSGPSAALTPLTILFGSQTGSAEALAKRAAKAAGQRAFAATVIDLASYTPDQLAREKNVLLITSTFGDGEPPDNAKAFHKELLAEGAPNLAGLRFSVCGLGDTAYVRFCQCGKDFDSRLEKLGAERAAPRADCELDYEEAYTRWLDAALGALATVPTPAPAAAAAAKPQAEAAPGTSRKHPVEAPLIRSRILSLPGSQKEVQHVEFSLAQAGLAYEPGDALGVYAQNCPELVAELLALLGCDGEEAVPAPDGSAASLRHALTARYDLGRPSPELRARYAAPQASAGTEISQLHVIDVVASRAETRLPPVEFVRLLRPLQPRLYSIASSLRAHPGQAHLTVGVVRYEAHGRARKGVCSTFLADRCTDGASAPVFVHHNPAFKLPADPGAPIIMIGPGTGIAPFRAFLEERGATGATGRNWLFFGDQHAATDYLYRDELAAMQGRGLLTRLDTAFSRDQEEKIYVQHRMAEQAAELHAWLEGGAHLYVCGDASRMAKDVDAALHHVIEKAGAKSAAQAAEYVQALKASRRYARDIY